MDKISLFVFLTVALPEAILNIYFGFLICGEKIHLFLNDRTNLKRLPVAALLMALAAALTRRWLPNFVPVFLCNVVLYTAILKFVFKLKWEKAFATVIVFYGFLVTIELSYPMQVMAAMGHGPSYLFNNDTARLLMSIPQRLLQLFAIITLWNAQMFAWEHYKQTRLPFVLFVTLLLTGEVSFMYFIWYNLDTLPPVSRIFCMAGCLVFATGNLLMFRFVSYLTNAIMERWFKRNVKCINAACEYLKSIREELEKGNSEQAVKICNEALDDKNDWKEVMRP